MPEVRRGTAKPFPTIAGAAIGVFLLGLAVSQLPVIAQSVPSTGAVTPVSSPRLVLDRYCVTCHNERLKTAGLRLDQIDVATPGAEPEVWEKVVRKLHTGIMPPVQHAAAFRGRSPRVLTWLETSLDAASAARPNPGRTETLRRLNRTEYQNAIRDLLALDIDAAVAPAARRERPRLRQRDGQRSAADAPGPLHLGRAENQPPGDRPHVVVSAERRHSRAARPHAGRSYARPADRHARRGGGALTRSPRTASTTSRSGSRALSRGSVAGCETRARTN